MTNVLGLIFQLSLSMIWADETQRVQEATFRNALKCYDLGGQIHGSPDFLAALGSWREPVSKNSIVDKQKTISDVYKHFNELMGIKKTSKYQDNIHAHFQLKMVKEETKLESGIAMITRTMPIEMGHQLDCGAILWPVTARPACVFSNSNSYYSREKCSGLKTSQTWHTAEIVSSGNAALPGEFCKVTPNFLANALGASEFDWYNLLDEKPDGFLKSKANQDYQNCISAKRNQVTAQWCVKQLKTQVVDSMNLLQDSLNRNLVEIQQVLKNATGSQKVEISGKVLGEVKEVESRLGQRFDSYYPDRETQSVCSALLSDETIQSLSPEIRKEYEISKLTWKQRLDDLAVRKGQLKVLAK